MSEGSTNNTLRVPCPLCSETVTLAPEDVTVQVAPVEPGKGLKRTTVRITAVGLTSHVHGRSKA